MLLNKNILHDDAIHMNITTLYLYDINNNVVYY